MTQLIIPYQNDYNCFGHNGSLVQHEHARLLIAFQPKGWTMRQIWGELDVNPSRSYVIDGILCSSGISINDSDSFLENHQTSLVYFRYTPKGLACFKEPPETDSFTMTIEALTAPLVQSQGDYDPNS